MNSKFEQYVEQVKNDITPEVIVTEEISDEGAVNLDYVMCIVTDIHKGTLQAFKMANMDGVYKLKLLTNLHDLENSQVIEALANMMNNVTQEITHFENSACDIIVDYIPDLNEYWDKLLEEPSKGFNSKVDIVVDYDECLSEIQKLKGT
jgi:hypothetical protein